MASKAAINFPERLVVFNKECVINLCACLGAAYGEPYCYCTMKHMGLEKEMDENPLRMAANEKAKESLKGLEKFFEMNRKANVDNS